MATNSGAWSSETAGTATLIIFDCVSAENAGFSSTSNKNVSEMMIVRRSIVAPGVNRICPAYPKHSKMSSLASAVVVQFKKDLSLRSR